MIKHHTNPKWRLSYNIIGLFFKKKKKKSQVIKDKGRSTPDKENERDLSRWMKCMILDWILIQMGGGDYKGHLVGQLLKQEYGLYIK